MLNKQKLSTNTKTQKNFLRPTQLYDLTTYVNLNDSVLNIFKFLAVGLKSHSIRAPATRLTSKQNACSASLLLTSQLLWDDWLDRPQFLKKTLQEAGRAQERFESAHFTPWKGKFDKPLV